MITELRVKGWRCLRDVTLAPTPLHALIGPNDSGKSTLLDALFFANVLAVKAFGGGSEVDLRADGLTVHIGRDDEARITRGEEKLGATAAGRDLGFARKVRLDPDRLREPSPLLAGDVFELGERGEHLPGVYDAILNRNREAWDAIEDSVRIGFPTVRRLALRAVTPATKTMEVELVDGTRVPAAQMSEGLLYWLAFAALPYISPAKLLLIEEPENGLHPARIAEVVQVLRRVVDSGTQVVLATHSPLLVNELRPEEVSVVTRTADVGTQIRRADTIPDLDRLLSAFSLGEVWLAFADGKQEGALFDPRGAQS